MRFQSTICTYILLEENMLQLTLKEFGARDEDDEDSAYAIQVLSLSARQAQVLRNRWSILIYCIRTLW